MKQITIILDSRQHAVADISTLMAEHGINIDSIDADDVKEYGVVSLSVNRYDDALHLLREAGYQAISEDALVVRIEDKPGALAEVSTRFKNAGVMMRSMRIVQREQHGSVVAIVASPMETARELVQDILVR
jgi:hypothetical protein